MILECRVMPAENYIPTLDPTLYYRRLIATASAAKPRHYVFLRRTMKIPNPLDEEEMVTALVEPRLPICR